MVYYFEPDNLESLSTAIVTLYHNKNLMSKLSENSKAFLSRNGWQNLHKEFLEFYDSM
jgi:glycosyltransferase involved in cell wall biosynthesis